MDSENVSVDVRSEMSSEFVDNQYRPQQPGDYQSEPPTLQMEQRSIFVDQQPQSQYEENNYKKEED